MGAESKADTYTISDTANWVAYHRAVESARPDAVFKDPLAERLAGQTGKDIVGRAPKPLKSGWPVIARTVAIDDMVRMAVAEGCDCVLNLAAGLDTRPYRLELPAALPWIEADLPGMIAAKERLLARRDAPLCASARRRRPRRCGGARGIPRAGHDRPAPRPGHQRGPAHVSR